MNAMYANAAIGFVCGIGTGAVIAEYFRVHRIYAMQLGKFRRCARCQHGKWCFFARPDWEPQWAEMSHEQRLAVCARCTCVHIATEACGTRAGETAVGQCDHDYEMCVMPAKHKRPSRWSMIKQADCGRSTIEFVDVKTATETDREEHRERLRAAGRKPAPPSPRNDEDTDEQDKTA